jgi:hypothetical protein
MLILTRFSIWINLLKEGASNNKLKYISFYINLFKRVKINKDKRLSKIAPSFQKPYLASKAHPKGVVSRLFPILTKRSTKLYIIYKYL